MTPEQFRQVLQTRATELERYAQMQFPQKAANIALRFIDGNFRAGGYQGRSFTRWKQNKRKSTTLVDSGALRAATSYSLQTGQATIFNRMAYAKMHNEGFKGAVTVKSHDRFRHRGDTIRESYTNRRGNAATRTVRVQAKETVRSHIRNMNIPQRQFMPKTGNDSPVLNKAIQREVNRDLLQILRS